MPSSFFHPERHLVSRIDWLHATILLANYGIVSTASLIVGVAAAAGSTSDILLAGTVGLVAGAMSMAAGGYVSVRSQSDTERAEAERERRELVDQPEAERRVLAAIYVGRGLEPSLADEVARQLMANDTLGAYPRNELGMAEETTTRSIQAALTSAASFAVGSILPWATALLVPAPLMVPAVSIDSLLLLALLGAIGARAGGAVIRKATLRVTSWGAIAMATTAVIGAVVGTSIG